MLRYPNLFKPFKIGNTVFRNRIFLSPTGYMDFYGDGTTPTEEFIAYYERKAMGGAATVCVGECHLLPQMTRTGKLGIDMTDDSVMRFMNRLAERVKRLGAVPSMELQHGGMAADAGYGPVAGGVPGYMDKECHAMTEEEIYDVIEMFAAGAERAKYYGFGMVTVHGGHGWLLHQFFSPVTNKRTDKWGGSAENRARLAVAVCDAIHERCGKDFPIEIRISLTEFEDGYDVDEGVKYAQALDGHADIIHCSAGLHGRTIRGNSLRWAPSMLDEDGPFAKYAAEVKQVVKKSFVASVAGHSDPEKMEELISSGKTDIICMARALGCDPDLPNKARAGRYDEIRKCIRCYGCSDSLFPTFRILCALNPETGRENEYTRFSMPPEKKNVLVVGGGMGGMQAAISCAQYGHSVTLCEKQGKLGGILLCEEGVPFKKLMHDYIELQKNTLKKLGVEVKLSCEVTPELIEKLAPDAVIASVGGECSIPEIEGVDGANVITVDKVFADPTLTGQRVVVIGAGLSGAELGLWLNMLGKDVEIIEIAPKMMGPQVQSMVVRHKLEDNGVFIKFNTTASKITGKGVQCTGPDGEFFVEADTVVIATGIKPLFEEAFKLGAVSPVFHMIGDCAGGRNIKNATESAHTIAGMIGRCC